MYKRVISFLMVTFMMLGMVSLPVSAAVESEKASDSSAEQGQITETVQMSWLNSLFQLDDEKTAYTIQDSLCVEVSTNEKIYQEKDTVEVTIRVQNSNEIKVKNLSLEPVLPKGYKLAEEEKAELAVRTLPVGKSVTLTVQCVPDKALEWNIICFIGLGVSALAGAIGMIALFVKKKKLLALLPAVLTAASLVGILIIFLGRLEKPDEREKISLATNVTVAEAEYSFGVMVRYDEIKIDPDTVFVEYVTFLSDEMIINAEEYYATRVKKGNIVPEPPAPQAQIMEFVGWYKDMEYIETFDFSEPVSEATYVYAKWEMDETDTDGEGFYDVLENYYGTNVNAADTDADGLSDYIEFNIKTSPFLADTDGNGVLDYDEDADDDKLTNGEEAGLGTDAGMADTDVDGLDDYQEVKEYGTNPRLADSDGDGLDDYWEISGGFDPLKKNKKFAVSAASEEVSEYNPVAAKVELNLAGEQVTTLNVEQVTITDNSMVRSTLPGYMGPAYDFTVEGEIEEATLTFTYDTEMYGEPDEDFQPRIYYLNEETKLYEELKNQVVENGVVKAKTTHFSTYILLNKTEFDKVWETSIRPPEYTGEDQKSGLDVVLLIDYSLSMPENDPNDLRKDAAKLFLDKLQEGDRATVIPFSGDIYDYVGLTEDIESLKQIIDTTELTYGTELTPPIKAAIELLNSEQNNKYKYIIFLTDGEGDYKKSYTEKAADSGIAIFTIGLGENTSISVLQGMANGTGGSYFHVSSADGLNEAFEETSKATIDYITDSNNDGISDYHAQLLREGKVPYGDMFYGYNFEENADADGDGLKNGEEIQVVQHGELVYLVMKSNPLLENSDFDGVNDYEEIKNGSNPLVYSVDKQAADALYDDYNFYHSIQANDYHSGILGKFSVQSNAFAYGIFDQEKIYRDIMINFFLEYPCEEYMEDRMLQKECGLLMEALLETVDVLSNSAEIIDSASSNVDEIKGIYELINELNKCTSSKKYKELQAKSDALFERISHALSDGTVKVPEDGMSTKFLNKFKSVVGSEKLQNAYDNIGDAIGVAVLATDIVDTISIVGAIESNSERFEEAISILNEIALYGNSSSARSAASNVLEMLTENYAVVLDDVVRSMTVYGMQEFADLLLGEVFLVKAVTLVRDGIDIAGGVSSDVEQIFEMFAYAELAKATTSLLKENLVQNGAFYEVKLTAVDIPIDIQTCFVYLANIRVLGEKKYLEVLKQDGLLIDWYADEKEESQRNHIQGTFDAILEMAPSLNIPVYD